MIGLFSRAALSGLLAALLGAAMLAWAYASRAALVIELDRDLPRLVSGLYPIERDDRTGLTFAWTAAEMGLRAPGLDRRAPWTFDVRLRGARPDGKVPDLSFFVDGVLIETKPV